MLKARGPTLHKHLCLKCSTRAKPTVWEHDASECFVPHPTAKDCPACTGDDSSKFFWHKHYCEKHSHEWEHIDKVCLLQKKDEHGAPEVWTLDCPGKGPGKPGASVSPQSASDESGGTAQMSRPRPKIVACPKCNTMSAEQTADAGGITGHDEFVCFKCGYEFTL